MKKVYCKNCKWNYLLFCYPPKEKVRDYYWFGGDPWILPSCMKKYEHQQREKLNKNGNCKYYKRKWWKVWVR